jgi:DNA-binding response OmpR family regulator
MTANDGKNFWEIHLEIDNLIQKLVEMRAEEKELLRKIPLKEQKTILFRFDDTSRSVSWFGSSIHLNVKPYRLVKTLSQSPTYRANFDTIEKKVWKRGENDFVPLETMKTLIRRTNEVLRSHKFPYKIFPFKSRKTGEILGFILK